MVGGSKLLGYADAPLREEAPADGSVASPHFSCLPGRGRRSGQSQPSISMVPVSSSSLLTASWFDGMYMSRPSLRFFAPKSALRPTESTKETPERSTTIRPTSVSSASRITASSSSADAWSSSPESAMAVEFPSRRVLIRSGHRFRSGEPRLGPGTGRTGVSFHWKDAIRFARLLQPTIRLAGYSDQTVPPVPLPRICRAGQRPRETE